MRTTINLDEDAYELATLFSKGRGISLSAAVSELVRKGIEAVRNEPSRLTRGPKGLLMFADTGRVITNEMVKAALEEDDD